MIWSYIKTILRNISSSKVYFFINVAGLAVGFTVFTLIMLFVLNELNYDTFNKNANRIYRVVEIQKSGEPRSQRVAITMPALAPALKGEFPQIESTARFVPLTTVLCHSGGKQFYEDGLSFADSSIFDIFTFHFIYGHPSTALDGPYNIVIDKSTAEKYFGNTNPIGKTISINADLQQSEFQITGVIQDFPQNSHLHFNMIASFAALQKRWNYYNGWSSNDVVTYVLLRKGVSPEKVTKRLPTFLASQLPQDVWTGLELYFQPLESIHLYSNQILFQVNYNRGNIDNVRLFILIAFFVIALACINFINLTTARSAIRTREVGIRKLLGSYHSHLVYQFIGESILISFVSLLISLPIVEAMLPTFNSMMHERIIIQYNNHLTFLLFLALVAIFVGLIAGVYPAFYLSSFRPADLLRARFSSSRKGVFLRKGLITVQFAVAIGLVTSTATASQQMQYVFNKTLGFNEKNLLYIPLRDAESRSKIPLLSQRLLSNPKILDVSAGELTGAGGTRGPILVLGPDGKSRITVRKSYADYGYIQTMGMTLALGKGFSRSSHMDSSSVVINETMARSLSWQNPIGKNIELANGSIFSVIGVVKDFNYFSLRNKIDPLVMWLNPDRCKYLLIRVDPRGVTSTVDSIRRVWSYILPNHPFEYGFLANYLDKQYGSERQNEQLLGMFSVVAVVVACLGLFGLTLHTTEQRTKEIGIRKVLGASLPDIVFMLSRETAILILVACAVAWPVAYYFMNRWLDNFAYRIHPDPWTFIFSGLVVFIVAMLTLSVQATKAGLSNPADALRYE